MQRVRMSLPYFKKFGWEAEVVTVKSKYSDMLKDDIMLQSIPADIEIHRVKAFDKSWTSRFGLGSLALRSLWFYRQEVNHILRRKRNRIDLIYFSTTEFPVCILGAYWKRKFGVPYIIDMQDPWHSEYYQDKPKHQRPAKYWFSYPLHKNLEPVAIKQTDGLISVSQDYIDELKKRYPEIKDIPEATIPFGAFEPDKHIAKTNRQLFKPLLTPGFTNIVYIGRGGADMHNALTLLFEAFKYGLEKHAGLFAQIKMNFIGTSYAPKSKGSPTVIPLAQQFGIENSVVEITDRISYYHTIDTLQQADCLFIPGSDDPKYTASKIYPYLLINKPLLAIFNEASPAIGILKEYGAEHVYGYNTADDTRLKIYRFLKAVLDKSIKQPHYNAEAIEKYSAMNMTQRQCEFFDTVLKSTRLQVKHIYYRNKPGVI